ncbi:MAG: PdaC/SigV domain-containing protein, partial [Chitinophagales bacterium]
MKRFCILLLLPAISFQSLSQTVGFIRRYDGNIGKESVVATLKIIDTTIEGSFYYVKVGQPILLSGTTKNNIVSLNEVFNDSVIGNFSGTIAPEFLSIKGSWRNSPVANPVSFNWKQSHAAGSAVLGVVSRNHEYVWKTNKKGDHLGATGSYSYCFITAFEFDSVKLKINNELLEGAATDTDAASLKDAALDLMGEDFSDYQDEFDSAFANANTEQDAKFMEESPQVYQWNQQAAWEVLFNENYLLTIRAFYYEYTGGAHGNYSYSNIVFSLKT